MKLKSVMFIAFHFPPLLGSSGILRTLKFSKYLPEFNINPLVLTAHTRAYDRIDLNLLKQIPSDVYVKRAFALNTKKHLSIKGKYLELFSLPDQYSSWILGGILSGLLLIYFKKVDIIYSTYPIASAHVIGFILHLLTGRPWIADFRDPMKDEFIPLSNLKLKTRTFIENLTLKHATRVVVTTNRMKKLYLSYYPDLGNKISVIMNGYDEQDFEGLTRNDIKIKEPIRLIHAGLLDPIDRNPIPFFEAVQELINQDKISHNDLLVELYAPGYDEIYNQKINHLGLKNFIKILPPVSYEVVLEKMVKSHILLLFQGPTCDTVIPAKIFEYFRVGRPIFALTTEEGETGRLIRQTNGGEIIPINDPKKISNALYTWISNIKNNISLPIADKKNVLPFSRKEQAGMLAKLLKKVS